MGLIDSFLKMQYWKTNGIGFLLPSGLSGILINFSFLIFDARFPYARYIVEGAFHIPEGDSEDDFSVDSFHKLLAEACGNLISLSPGGKGGDLLDRITFVDNRGEVMKVTLHSEKKKIVRNSASVAIYCLSLFGLLCLVG